MSEYQIIPNDRSLVVYSKEAAPKEVFSHMGVDFERPTSWPASITWPPKELLDRIDSPNMTKKELHLHREFIDRHTEAMAKRAKRVQKYLFQNPVATEDVITPRLFQNKIQRISFLLPKIKNDLTRAPTDSIAWGFLLEPDSKRYSQVEKSIASFGFNTMTTIDGGRLTANSKGVQINKFSQQAAELLVIEAMARGWTTLDVNGPKETVDALINIAKTRGLGINATVISGPLGMIRTSKIVPAPDKRDFVGPEAEELSSLAGHFAKFDSDDTNIDEPEELSRPTGNVPMMG